jgi:Protein of unknown function (DUF4245)
MSNTGARRSGSFVDALRTIGVLGALLIASFFVGKFFTVHPDRPASVVPLGDAVAGARAIATFDVIAPQRLPAGADATSARFTPDTWHLGVLTKDKEYLGLEQAVAKPATLVHDFAAKSRVTGSAQVAGRRWVTRAEADGDRVYVRDFGATSVLVISSANRAETERYVSSLVVP